MNIKDLSNYFPEKVIQYYFDSGIKELYPPQAEAINKGLLSGNNILAAIPTASGKTLLAELAILKNILGKKRGKALYIVPLRALATEKYEHFSEFGKFGVKVGISTGDFDSKDEYLGINDLIITTSEKADSLLRNEVNWINKVSIVIADEIHLIDSASRGPTLEITLAKLRHNTKAQIIALSATIGNSDELAKWLKAELILSEWRPVDLREGVFFQGEIFFPKNNNTKKIKSDKDALIALVIDTLSENGQCLIFESSRRNSETTANKIGNAIKSFIDFIDQINEKELKELALEILEISETAISEKLAKCLKNGAAFHHAGLNSETRKLIEDGFRNNIIKVIACTPTLAAGLNLPARRVIIKGYKRYDPNFGMVPIPVLEYKQMSGRAGRPHLDPYGESVLIAKNYQEFSDLTKNYIMADVEPILSKLKTESALRTHVLSTVVSGFASTKDDLMEFMSRTFYAFQYPLEDILKDIDMVLIFLENNKMLENKKEKKIKATNLGKLVSRLYIDPLSAIVILNGIKNLSEESIKVTDLTLLHLICKTPDMQTLYLGSKDYDWIKSYVYEHSYELLLQENESYEWFLSEVKTATLLIDGINEKHEKDISDNFRVGPGDIRRIAETAEWLMHSLAELSSFIKSPYTNLAKALVYRIKYGASLELLELITLKDIGRIRARKLYNAGYTNIKKLHSENINKIAKIIGPKIAQKIFK
ncbi:MAG: ATP-dependent DNA helicase [Methanosarcinales archaeon]